MREGVLADTARRPLWAAASPGSIGTGSVSGKSRVSRSLAAGPGAGVPELQAADGDTALVLLVVTGVIEARVQVNVTILFLDIPL